MSICMAGRVKDNVTTPNIWTFYRFSGHSQQIESALPCTYKCTLVPYIANTMNSYYYYFKSGLMRVHNVATMVKSIIQEHLDIWHI